MKKAKAQEKKDHANSIVTQAKPIDIPCKFCEKMFENKGSLGFHIVDAHAKTTNTDVVETIETLISNVKEENKNRWNSV